MNLALHSVVKNATFPIKTSEQST